MAIVPRLLYFAIERAAEPVSNRLETAAASSPLFQSVCKSIAQAVANVEHNKHMRRIIHDQKMANMQEDATLGKPGSSAWQPADDLEPPPMLDEREATQRGCELLGEDSSSSSASRFCCTRRPPTVPTRRDGSAHRGE